MAVDEAISTEEIPAFAVVTPRFAIFSPLRFRPFTLFWLAAMFIWATEYVRSVAIASVALDLTGRPSGLANVLTLSAIPVTILLLFGGLAADRFRPHVVVMGALFLSATNVGVLSLLSATGSLAYWHLLVYAVMSGIAGGFFNGAYFAVAPSLLSADVMRSANGLMSVTENLSRFVTPPLAGLLVAAAGAPPTLAVASALALGAALLLRGIATQAPAPASVTPHSANDAEGAGTHGTHGTHGTIASVRRALGQLAEGFRVVRQDPVLWPLIWTGTIAIFGMSVAMVVGFPSLAKLALNGGDEGIGILYGALGAGALAGALLTGAVKSVRRPGLVLTLCGVAEGLLLLPAAFAPTLWLAVPFVVLCGLVEAVRVVLALTLLQTRPPAAVRGRVMAIAALSAFGLNPVAHAVAGAIGDNFGPRAIVVFGGSLLALGCALGAASKSVRRAALV